MFDPVGVTADVCDQLSGGYCTCFEAQCSGDGVQYSDVLNCDPGDVTCELLPGRGNATVNVTDDGRPSTVAVPATTSIGVMSDGGGMITGNNSTSGVTNSTMPNASQPKFTTDGFDSYVLWAKAQCVWTEPETPECAGWKSRAERKFVFPAKPTDPVQVKDTSGNTVLECTPYGVASCVVVEGPLKGELWTALTEH